MAKQYKTIITISLKIDELSVKFIPSAPNRPHRGLITETSWNLAIQNNNESSRRILNLKYLPSPRVEKFLDLLADKDR
jgi:hypothetical protein